MGTDITPDNIRAFLIPHSMTIDNLWDAESSYTTQQTQPAAPKAGSSYDMGLTATGSFDGDQTLRIQTQRAGHIGRASFVWREENETDFYGYNTANIIERWEPVIDGTATAGEDFVLCDAMGNNDGSAVFLYQYEETSVQNIRTIRAVHRDKAGSLTSSNIFSQSSNSPTLFGGLCALQDGSILAVYMEANNDKVNLRSARSYDQGITWNEQSKTLITEDIDLTGAFGFGATGYDSVQRIRIAEAKGEILLIVSAVAHNTTPASTDVVLQYVSTDNGCSFVYVGLSGGSFAYYRPDVVSRNGVFWVAYISGTGESEILKLESATQKVDISKNFSPIEITDQLVAGGLTSGHFTEGELSLWTNSTGRFYACFFDVDTDRRIFILQSDDGNEWYYLGGNPNSNRVNASKIYDVNDSTSRPSIFCGCSSRGINQFFHNYETASHARDNGIHVLELGGYTTVNNPYVTEYPKDFDLGGWDNTWVSYDTPNATSHYTKIGTGTITPFAQYTRFSSTNPNFTYVETPTFTSSASEGIFLRTRMKVVSQGDSTSGRGIKIITNDNEIDIYISTTGITVYDALASSTIGSQTTTVTTDFEILAMVQDNNVKVWSCINRDTAGEKRWSLVADGTANSTGGLSTNQIKWGHISATSGAGSSTLTNWYEFCYSYGDRTGGGILNQTNPDDLNARLYPPKGKNVYITEGTKISTFDSPTYIGDYYTIEKDSLYPLRRIFHSNSPTTRTKYKSANDTTTHNFSFFWNTDNQDDSNIIMGNNSIGVFLGGINFQTFDVDIYDVSISSWTNLATINTRIGGTTFERIGSSVRCTLATEGEYIHQNELAGYFLDMGSGIVRRIKTNTAGYIGIPTNGKRCVMELDSFEITDPTTITGKLYPNRTTAVFHLASQTAGCAIRISIPAQSTPENVFEIGAFQTGPLLVTQQYSNGRTISSIPGIVTNETIDGTRHTKKNRDPYRTIRIAWTEGVDTSQIYDSVNEADFYTLTTAAGAEPVATPADTPTSILGLISTLDGEKTPVVYIPKLTRSIKTATTLQRKDEFIYCTIQDDISIEHVLGDELNGTNGDGEVFRISTLTLREVL